MVILLPALVAAVIAAAMTAHLAGPRARLRWMDLPNERSLHTTAVPRTGGVAMLAGIFGGALAAGVALGVPQGWGWVAVAAAAVAVVAAVDDWRGLGVLPRLGVQLLAAGAIVAAGLYPSALSLGPGAELDLHPGFAAVLAGLFIVWMTNLYNFMDGMDGFAGGMAMFGFASMAGLGWLQGEHFFAAVNLAIALAAAGFLWFNFPPARIFMGDTGSSTLGLLAAAAMLWADRAGVFPLWAGILIFSPFIADATLTLILRIRAGKRIWQAHREHAYQRLVGLGWSHRRAVLTEYGVMAAASCSAFVLMMVPDPVVRAAVLGAWMLFYVILIFMIRRQERRRCKGAFR